MQEQQRLQARQQWTALPELRRYCLGRALARQNVDLNSLIINGVSPEHPKILEIGKDCAAHLKEPFRSIDHGRLLYDEKGLPR